MARSPRPGDKQIREEDCYLFLEAVLSARSQLIVTYTGMSISDNAPIPCAGPVDILKDTMAESFVFPDGFQWELRHPLHPFSPAYFDGSRPGLFSFSQSMCDIAADQRKGGAEKVMAASGTEGEAELPENSRIWLNDLPTSRDRGHGETDEAAAVLDMDTLIRFFRHPAETFVRESVGVRFPLVQEAAQDRERFQVSGLDRYGLGTDCLFSSEDLDLLQLARSGGRLPLGQKGNLEWEQIRMLSESISVLADEVFPKADPEHLDIRIRAADLCFRGRVGDVSEDDI